MASFQQQKTNPQNNNAADPLGSLTSNKSPILDNPSLTKATSSNLTKATSSNLSNANVPLAKATENATVGAKRLTSGDFIAQRGHGLCDKNSGPVLAVQRKLAEIGLMAKDKVDGKFGIDTEENIEVFQKAYNDFKHLTPSDAGYLKEDGIVGANTWAAMNKLAQDMAKQTSQDPAPQKQEAIQKTPQSPAPQKQEPVSFMNKSLGFLKKATTATIGFIKKTTKAAHKVGMSDPKEPMKY